MPRETARTGEEAPERGPAVRIGVLADTHGLLRSEVLEALDGVGRILHAGDVGRPEILTKLEAIAPVAAVWGNVDGFAVRSMTSESRVVDVGGLRVGLIHGHQAMPRYERLVDRFPDAGLVVYGHTHIPSLDRVGNVLLLNPGSAGPRRFGRPATLAVVDVGASGPPSVVQWNLDTGEPMPMRPA